MGIVNTGRCNTTGRVKVNIQEGPGGEHTISISILRVAVSECQTTYLAALVRSGGPTQQMVDHGVQRGLMTAAAATVLLDRVRELGRDSRVHVSMLGQGGLEKGTPSAVAARMPVCKLQYAVLALQLPAFERGGSGVVE